jgi:uncharacterized repeat protein (TIGR02543 family)
MTTLVYGNNNTYTLPTNTFIKNGYVFNGWNTKKDGSGTSYKDMAEVKDLVAQSGQTVTLYAQWKKNESPKEDEKVPEEDKKPKRKSKKNDNNLSENILENE